jgi:hypothetical protein
MNDLPASADCGQLAAPLATNRFRVATQATKNTVPLPPTTPISSTPLPFDTTNGDILAITKIDGTTDLAIGGNFTAVITPDGQSHSAKNFAIVSEATGAVQYAGNASSYVRAITSLAGTTYVGGDFTSFGGVAHSHLVAISPTFSLLSWAPSISNTVRALAVDATGLYVGGDLGFVEELSTATTSVMWSKSTSGGDVHSLMLYDGFLYVGGLFETYNGTTQHGLVQVVPATGLLVPTFNANLRADTNVGIYGAYDGEEIISMSPGPNSSEIIVGSGGHGPPGLASNETILMNATTGARFWSTSTIGESQAEGLVGDTVVAGYHRNVANTTVPYPYFATQLELSNGVLTTWDPRLTGLQSNADGGNNGVQAIYVDQTTDTIYIAGAFTQYNDTNPHNSLIAFTFS